jgi:hypothetical protein
MVDDGTPESLTAFIDRKTTSPWTVQLVNPTGAAPIRKMAETVFGGLDVDLTEIQRDDRVDDLLLLLRDGEVVASSPLSVLEETLLLVNSDLYSTGTRNLEDVEVPDVIHELSDTVFRLQGYPDAHAEKLVLTLLSRSIERQAMEAGAGTLRASFQWLSRLDDEGGTREVYQRLGDRAGLETHVYGVPDWTAPPEFGPIVHETRDDEIVDHWFVLYRSEGGPAQGMLATRADPNTWQGYWTTDATEIRAIERYVAETF